MTRPLSFRNSNSSFIILMLIIFTIGISFSWWMVVRVDRETRLELLQQTRLVAQALNIESIKEFTATNADMNNPGYQQLKEKLIAIRMANLQSRFIYLIGRKTDHTVFFFVDSESPNSNDYSPPGQVYDEVSDATQRVFDDKTAFVDGPVTDRWGVWVSPLVPIIDPHTGAVVAVLGMDINARSWVLEVTAKSALPVGLMLSLLIGVAVMFTAGRRVDASPKPVLWQMLPSLAIMIVLLMVGTGLLLWQQNRQYMSRKVAEDIFDVSSDLQMIINQQVSVLTAVLQPIATDSGVKKALREGDANHLLTAWAPVFKTLQRDNKITHFYFYDKKRVCILRVHNPERHAQIINHFLF